MSKREVFHKINDLIEQWNGRTLKLNSKLTDSALDELGYLLLLLGLDHEYGIMKDIPKEGQLSYLKGVTMKQLINTCVLSKCQKQC